METFFAPLLFVLTNPKLACWRVLLKCKPFCLTLTERPQGLVGVGGSLRLGQNLEGSQLPFTKTLSGGTGMAYFAQSPTSSPSAIQGTGLGSSVLTVALL